MSIVRLTQYSFHKHHLAMIHMLATSPPWLQASQILEFFPLAHHASPPGWPHPVKSNPEASALTGLSSSAFLVHPPLLQGPTAY